MILEKKYFTPQISTLSHNLPLTLIFLKEWSLIKFTGTDILQYLQGQLTCNINNLTKNFYNLTAYCNPKGKLISSMYIFYLKTGIGCIQRLSICHKQVTLMKKYAIFSKINIIIDNETIFLGFAGQGARSTLNLLFDKLPNEKKKIIYYKDSTILHFNLPKERFLILTNKKIKDSLTKKFKNKINFSYDNQWNILDIEAGYPIIDSNTSELFLPQETNIQNFNAISFNKGCYIGQEIITRMQFKGIHKRKLYLLFGKISRVPLSGEKLEYKKNTNNHWTIAGTILSACALNQGTVWIQAILNSSLKKNTIFRLHNSKKDNQITIHSSCMQN
ncbi:tRNA-modifying protein YgfZ [Blochmannia endosymbiont of Camponotus (Colobopsis) obliquus]|uniref:tRNA-modifying protein YgfZ n=1 Tax=Blochmannia endosymbiont of Camponotus (Colobopsis) obliquus TaxID=1505597 RepID=UPI00061A60A2|nr:tRNA-modifying protein YgfZ [Blochmannia endosymbiont of Camponotus (Colobopsis) obliquus]AKC60425.1 tRNA-modifying protein ygfZ [Blochmannia endosymbiont of Camponotus (Colobopsis) obliquus]